MKNLYTISRTAERDNSKNSNEPQKKICKHCRHTYKREVQTIDRAYLETLASSQSGYSGRIRKRGTSKRVEWTAVAGDAGMDSGRGTQAARDGD
jgi:hypothetical protein